MSTAPSTWNRRDFLKTAAASFAALLAPPVSVFVPPRLPFVSHQPSLMGLYSHLGVLPTTRELSVCEGRLLEIGDWDEMGYPCLIENACTFGPKPPRAWIYDFDLWNFRHDDGFAQATRITESRRFNSHAAWYASRRFGEHFCDVVKAGGGFLYRQIQEAGGK